MKIENQNTQHDNNIIMIICTIPNDSKHSPISIAKTLITKKLAACVNVLPNICSIYPWNESIQEEKETQLIIKTYKTLEQAVFQQIKIQHPYQIPELLTFQITNGEEKYLSWIYNSLTKK